MAPRNDITLPRITSRIPIAMKAAARRSPIKDRIGSATTGVAYIRVAVRMRAAASPGITAFRKGCVRRMISLAIARKAPPVVA